MDLTCKFLASVLAALAMFACGCNDNCWKEEMLYSTAWGFIWGTSEKNIYTYNYEKGTVFHYE